MFNAKQIIFRFNDNNFDIVCLSRTLGKVKIKSVDNFFSAHDGRTFVYDTENNIKSVDEYFTKNKIRNKKVQAIISADGIITRFVEAPLLNKKDLKKFIDNNLSEYFTMNVDDYYFDYKVINFTSRKSKKLNIILYAFPKIKLADIYSFIENCGLIVDKITVYPDCIANAFKYLRDQSVAVLDLNKNRSIITILSKGSIFLYSTIESENHNEIEEYRKDIIDKSDYFLNFYLSRNFGNKVDQLYLIGEKCEDKTLYKSIEVQFKIPTVLGIADNGIKVSVSKEIDINKNCDIVGCVTKTREFNNKVINFVKVIEEKKEKNIQNTIRRIGLTLASVTMVAVISMMVYLYSQFVKYDTNVLKKDLYRVESIEKNIKFLTEQNKNYENKKKNLNAIWEDSFNYMGYLEALRNGLPSDILVNKISFDKEKVDLSLKIKNPMDKMKIVIAINKINVFEPIELDSVKLNNVEEDVQFSLIIAKPL